MADHMAWKTSPYDHEMVTNLIMLALIIPSISGQELLPIFPSSWGQHGCVASESPAPVDARIPRADLVG